MGDIMKASLAKSSLVVIMGLVLLGAQGCSTKRLQSEGDTAPGSMQSSRAGESGSAGDPGSEWNGQGVNPNFPGVAPNFPGVAQGGSQGELSGFSQNPSEEHLGHGSGIVSLPASEMNAQNYAELTKEEKAAIEAGLKDVFFGYDQWTLSEAGMEALNRNAKWLKDHPGAVLKVEGHCDERGTTDYNVVLGEKRSKSARSYLIEMGVNPKQVATVSYGKERPFCMEHNESCYQQNRRGHVLLSVKTKR
jgi:peptidoglycan-associated lipoprotein